MSNAINALITEQAPHILNQITTMGKIYTTILIIIVTLKDTPTISFLAEIW